MKWLIKCLWHNGIIISHHILLRRIIDNVEINASPSASLIAFIILTFEWMENEIVFLAESSKIELFNFGHSMTYVKRDACLVTVTVRS